MSSFNRRECLGCGQPCDGYHCYSCTCPQCGVILLNGVCINCTYGDGKPVTCFVCEGPLRGGFCLFCDLKAENSFTYDPNAYSFNDTSSNFNHLPQPQYETYLYELCGNNSHYGYDCQQYGGSHETFQCQPMDQNVDSSGSDQIQTPQKSSDATTPVLPTEEPEYSLSMGYEHLSTILKTESDKVTESSAKNLVPIPSEYEVTSDDESECDVSVKDDSSPVFTTFSNPLFDDNDDFTSSDDESLPDEDFDYLEEFSGALMPTSIADEERIRREHIEYISIMEKLFAINSCPRPLENFQSNTIVETLPSSTIPIEDRDIHFLEELLSDDSIPLPKNESFYFDHQDDPSFPRPPLEPPDVEFDFNPNSGEVISAVMNNIGEDECFDT
nr:hypothetical protein [Tanacetum cinerariifolium]